MGELGVVMVMVVAMVVASGCECRAGAYQNQKREEDELLHAMTIARFCPRDMSPKMQESRPLRANQRILGFSLRRPGRQPK